MTANDRLTRWELSVIKIGRFVWVLLPLLSGCATIHTVGTPAVRTIAVHEKFPTLAVVLIDQHTADALTRKRPIIVGWGRPHTFRLGAMLEQASTQAFSQVFQDVKVVRSVDRTSETPRIEPTAELIRFFYWPK